jgi:hypothetical protein
MPDEESATSNLYADGWRQGTVFKLDLPVTSLTIAGDGSSIAPITENLGLWVVASQDCDLAAAP